MGIPKIIHQMWIDKIIDNNTTVPDKYKKLCYPESWKKLNPDFEYVLWNRDKVKELFKHPLLARWKPFWYSIGPLIEQCDFARYAIMLVHGGVYVDLDFQCLKPVAPLLENRDVGLSWEPREHTGEGDGVHRRLYNGFFMSKPGQSIWALFMDYIIDHYSAERGALDNTGPIGLAKFVMETGMDKREELFIDTCLTLPYRGGREPTDDCLHDRELKNAYAVTYWDEGTGWYHGSISLHDENEAKKKKRNVWIYSSIGVAVVVAIVVGAAVIQKKRKHK
jgi:hypothetical protein